MRRKPTTLESKPRAAGVRTDPAPVNRGAAPDSFRALQRAAGNRPVHEIIGRPAAGEPLPPAVEREMSGRFGHDFGDVRVHTDAASARGMNAAAYTVGSDIVFDGGEYAPDTASGRDLLAHELAHTVQQARGARGGVGPAGTPALERSARTAADTVESGAGHVEVEGASATGVARETPEERAARENRRRGGFYDAREKALDLEDTFGKGKVQSSTVPGASKSNVSRRNRTPPPGVGFDARGFPIFDSIAVFDTRIDRDKAKERNRPLHMKAATAALARAIAKDPALAGRFDKNALDAIKKGAERIPGYTWEHHQEFGRMQLVPRDKHKATGHVGGYHMRSWPSGPFTKDEKASKPSAAKKKPGATAPPAGPAPAPAPKKAAAKKSAPPVGTSAPPSSPVAPAPASQPPSAQKSPAATPPAAKVAVAPPSDGPGNAASKAPPVAAKPASKTAAAPATPAAKADAAAKRPAPPRTNAGARRTTTGTVAPPPSKGTAPRPQATGEAKGAAAQVLLGGVGAGLNAIGEHVQGKKADAERARIEPQIEQWQNSTGEGVWLHYQYGAPVVRGESAITPTPMFEGITIQPGGRNDKRVPDIARDDGKDTRFSSVWIPPTSPSLKGELSELWHRQRTYQKSAENMAKEGALGRTLRGRSGSSIDLEPVYDARAHLSSASAALKQDRPGAARDSMDAAKARLQEMERNFDAFTGKPRDWSPM